MYINLSLAWKVLIHLVILFTRSQLANAALLWYSYSVFQQSRELVLFSIVGIECDLYIFALVGIKINTTFPQARSILGQMRPVAIRNDSSGFGVWDKCFKPYVRKVAEPIETCRLNDVTPFLPLCKLLRIVDGRTGDLNAIRYYM